MKLGVCANQRLPEALRAAREIVKYLKGGIVLEQSTAEAMGESGVRLEKMAADILLVVGGDGTMLQTLMRSDAAVLGINAGDVGFLTEAGLNGVRGAIDRILSGKYRIEEKIKLRTVVDGKRVEDAVNEAVVHTASTGKVRHFILAVDHNSVGVVKADGIIISTPTGSTSYSLAAGGPIVDPSASVLVISPIAPYGISSRPIVAGAKSTIRLGIEGSRPCRLVIDGQANHRLSGGETVEFSVSERVARFVRFDYDFYRRIHTKLTG